jgi:hypothetical protein
MSEETLAGFVLAHLDELDFTVELRAVDERHELVVAGATVAILERDRLEVRLRPAVAAAALRTPDTGSSTRGRGWIRFAPAELDAFARDRAMAWLESAVRLAIEGAPPVH